MKAHLFTFLAALSLQGADIFPQYIYEPVVENVVQYSPSKVAWMEVLDRSRTGSLVQLFEKREVFNGDQMVERRFNGEKVLVLGLGNGVGIVVKESRIYDMERTMDHKGTLYQVYDVAEPKPQFFKRTNIVARLNPDWVKLQEVRKTVAENTAKGEATSRIVIYQKEQAARGLPSFQFELAKRYLKGDGVEVNTNLAIKWLEAACTNRESQASNLLQKLRMNGR